MEESYYLLQAYILTKEDGLYLFFGYFTYSTIIGSWKNEIGDNYTMGSTG